MFILVLLMILCAALSWMPFFTKYFVMAPIIGFGLGGFAWSVASFVVGDSVVTWECFLQFVCAGYFVSAFFISKE